MMYHNIHLMMFILCLVMMGAFIHCLHAKNSYIKGDIFNKYIPIAGIIVSIITLVIIVYLECRIS